MGTPSVSCTCSRKPSPSGLGSGLRPVQARVMRCTRLFEGVWEPVRVRLPPHAPHLSTGQAEAPGMLNTLSMSTLVSVPAGAVVVVLGGVAEGVLQPFARLAHRRAIGAGACEQTTSTT